MRREGNLHQHKKGGQAKKTKVGVFYKIVIKAPRLQDFLQAK